MEENKRRYRSLILVAVVLFFAGCGRNEPIVGSWECSFANGVWVTTFAKDGHVGLGRKNSRQSDEGKWEKITESDSNIEYKYQRIKVEFNKNDPTSLVIDGAKHSRISDADAVVINDADKIVGTWNGRGYTEGNEVKLTISKNKQWKAKVQFGTKNGWEAFSGTWSEGRDCFDMKVDAYNCTDSYMESAAKGRGVIGATGRCRYSNNDTLSFNCPGSGGANYEMKRR